MPNVIGQTRRETPAPKSTDALPASSGPTCSDSSIIEGLPIVVGIDDIQTTGYSPNTEIGYVEYREKRFVTK